MRCKIPRVNSWTASNTNILLSRSVGDVTLVGKSRRNPILAWNSTPPIAKRKLVHETIRKRALAAPEKCAIRSWDGELTYRQLDDLALKLAHLLSQQEGMRAELIVPLHFKKSL